MSTTPSSSAGARLPELIQGGMGIGVSSWPLAGAVARQGGLGVVSGTALESVYARRLQLGDLDGSVRRAFDHFPVPGVIEQILKRYFVPGGKAAHEPFRGVPMYTLQPPADLQLLSVAANFAEVWLAKERALGGPVGINYLYKIQMPIPASLYGAMLAGVDCVIVGAGRPDAIPGLLRAFAEGREGSAEIKVQYALPGERYLQRFDPRLVFPDGPPILRRPQFLAIVASVELARDLAESDVRRPDGFVVEGFTAGGHNAPPRGPLRLDGKGQPLYGPLDEVDSSEMRALGLPFWLAGSHGRASSLPEALRLGASGIQVGTAFALCEESGLTTDLRRRILAEVVRGRLAVRTDARASPTGFPFKVVELEGTIADREVYDARRRVCDAGFLRVPYRTSSGEIGYRCPAEPLAVYARKAGRAEQAEGKACLCNGLLANIGLGQLRSGGAAEPPIVTAGDDLVQIARFVPTGETSYSVSDVLSVLRGEVCGLSPEAIDLPSGRPELVDPRRGDPRGADDEEDEVRPMTLLVPPEALVR